MREAKKHRIIALQLSFTIIYHCRDSPTHVHYGYPFAPSSSENYYFGLKIWFVLEKVLILVLTETLDL